MAGRPIYYGYYLIGAAFVAQFVSIGILSYVAGPFMAPMADDLGWSRAEFSAARSLAQVVMALTGFVIGGTIDRIGGRRLMLIGTVVLSVSLALHSRLDTLWQWLLLNGLATTVGCALVGNLVVNVTLAKWFVARRGQAVAWAAMGVSLGGIVITPFTTWAIDTQGWREAWVWLGGLVAVIMLPVAALMRRAPEDYGLQPDGMTGEHTSALAERARLDFERSMTRSQAIRTPSFYALTLAFGFFQINIAVVLLHSVPYITDAGFSRAQAAMTLLVASVPAMLSKPVWGYVIDRLPPKPLAAVSASTTGVALALIILSVQAGRIELVFAAFFVLGLGWGGMIPLQEVVWASFFGRRYLGAVRGAALPVALLLSAGAPYLVALHHDQTGSYDSALWLVAALNVLSGVLIHRVRPPGRSGESRSGDQGEAEETGHTTDNA